jgi:hypothetical protein
VARHAQDLAVVEGFELRQRVGVALDQVGQTQQQPLALDRADRGPGPLVEGEAGGLHGGVDIGPVGHGRLRHHGPGGGIDHRHVPALSRNERAVHQHAQRLCQKITRLRIRADHVDHITHVRCCPLDLSGFLAGSIGKAMRSGYPQSAQAVSIASHVLPNPARRGPKGRPRLTPGANCVLLVTSTRRTVLHRNSGWPTGQASPSWKIKNEGAPIMLSLLSEANIPGVQSLVSRQAEVVHDALSRRLSHHRFACRRPSAMDARIYSLELSTIQLVDLSYGVDVDVEAEVGKTIFWSTWACRAKPRCGPTAKAIRCRPMACSSPIRVLPCGCR